MAKRVIKAKGVIKYRCIDCEHSYDWHEIGANGKPFMCRCPYYTDGKYCRFLNDPQCEHFKMRQ
ncbi:hypothetical protein FNJ59_07460 [Bacteroides pyogenes]|uniref:Uncharacterized protein n=1 Tax=Bacteroides pyogenes TaxID=310300 RepID=A0A5D3FPR1_9BACE|nr:hypothetical protein FNJ60_04990 [Bacteroides pyogenes]TYK39364.1 hypothetical protein FNJ59_07460 [Bacteroides pyogenes]TYK50199.1 hypothetical protein FNG97_03970 [Bacteroides pyogenes]